jgi:SSS family solute:Na+ symporter
MAGSVLAASIVMVYVLLGGIRATIHTSIFQLFVIIAGLLPLLLKTSAGLPRRFADRPERWHLWAPLPTIAPHALLDRFGVIVGLGFVISFSYWCTDFVIVQRTLTARTLDSARKVPVLAGYGKLLMSFLVVLPGVAAPAYLSHAAGFSYDEALPALMRSIYGPTLLGLGVAALLASLMAGFAGNLSGFAAAWTQEVYRARLKPGRSEQHYIAASRWATTACFALAELVAWVAAQFGDLMEFLQMVVSMFYAPLLAVVLAAFLSRRTTERQACAAIVLGSATAVAIQIAARGGTLFGSSMTANFYVALISFAVASLTCVLPLGRLTASTARGAANIQAAKRAVLRPSVSLVVLSGLLLLSCLIVNLVWW